MKKGQIAEVLIESVSFPAKGRGRVLGYAVYDREKDPDCLVYTLEPAADNSHEETGNGIGGREYISIKNVIPGRRVLCRIRKVRSSGAVGEVLRVLEKAPGEIDPPCPHFGNCGGCIWLTMPYEDQLAMKSSQVRRILEAALPEDMPEGWYLGIKPSPDPLGYRNKMEYTFGDEYLGGPLSLGLHKRGSFYDILSVRECALVHTDFGRILGATLDYFSERGISYYHRVRHEGYLRYLLVRRGSDTGDILVDLVTASMDEDSESALIEGWVKCLLSISDSLEGHLTGILHTRDDSPSDTVTDEGTVVLYGRGSFNEKLLGLNFSITPFSFFQTNSKGAEVLYETVREMVSGIFEEEAADRSREAVGYVDAVGETGSDAEGSGIAADNVGRKPVIFDLYSGTGTIAQMVSAVAEKVVGVEIVEEAVLAARENAAGNGIKNCEFHAGDVLKVVPMLDDKPDLIILDPPRDGCHPKALPRILDFGAPFIIYISCKVTSLARDLELIQKRGYVLKKAIAVDQFPQVGHCEACCLLTKTS